MIVDAGITRFCIAFRNQDKDLPTRWMWSLVGPVERSTHRWISRLDLYDTECGNLGESWLSDASPMRTAAYRIGISTGGTGKSPEQSRWENGSGDTLSIFDQYHHYSAFGRRSKTMFEGTGDQRFRVHEDICRVVHGAWLANGTCHFTLLILLHSS